MYELYDTKGNTDNISAHSKETFLKTAPTMGSKEKYSFNDCQMALMAKT